MDKHLLRFVKKDREIFNWLNVQVMKQNISRNNLILTILKEKKDNEQASRKTNNRP